MEELIESIRELKDIRGELKDLEIRLRKFHQKLKEADDDEWKALYEHRIAYAQERQLSLFRKQHELQEIIDEADLSVLERRVLTLYYLDGLTWQQVAFRIGETDEQIPRKMRDRILKKNYTKNTKKL